MVGLRHLYRVGSPDAFEQAFGQHVRSLRRVRGLTQDALAERCGVSVDTIRRLEAGYSPSLDTIRKLVAGLDLTLGAFMTSLEIGERHEARELIDMTLMRSGVEIDLAIGVLRSLFDHLDRASADTSQPQEGQILGLVRRCTSAASLRRGLSR